MDSEGCPAHTATFIVILTYLPYSLGISPTWLKLRPYRHARVPKGIFWRIARVEVIAPCRVS